MFRNHILYNSNAPQRSSFESQHGTRWQLVYKHAPTQTPKLGHLTFIILILKFC